MNALVVSLVSLLLLLTWAPGGPPRLGVRSHRVERVANESREARLYEQALEMFAFDGAIWLTHFVASRNDATPIGITRIDRRGIRLFLAYEWLPAGTIPRGSVGSIHAVAPLPQGLLAASLAFHDRDGAVRNEIVILEEEGNGGYRCRRRIDAPGVQHVVAGPGNTLLGLTTDATKTPIPLVTVFDTDGNTLGELFPFAAGTSLRTAYDTAHKSRLRHLGGNQFALYASHTRRIVIFSVEGRPARATVLRDFSVADAGVPIEQRQAGIDDLFGTASGRVTIIRSGRVEGRIKTVATQYEPDGRIRGLWIRDEPYKRVTRRGNAILAIFAKDEVQLETLELDEGT